MSKTFKEIHGVIYRNATTLQHNGCGFVRLNPGTKVPMETNWQKKALEYTANDVFEWVQADDSTNYGVTLGKRGMILDVDIKPDAKPPVRGDIVINAINEHHNINLWNSTICVRTSSGGYHLYFRTYSPYSNSNNTFVQFKKEHNLTDENGNYMSTGIDIRGQAGQVVGPGSVLEEYGSDKPYQICVYEPIEAPEQPKEGDSPITPVEAWEAE